MWTYSLKFSLRSLVRELVRNMWGRLLVYPGLVANERSAPALAAYIARRNQALGTQADTDGTRLRRLDGGAPLLAKAELRAHPERYTRPRGLGSLVRGTIKTSGTSGSPLTLVQTLA